MRRIAMAAILVMAAIGVWAVGTKQASYVVTFGVSMQPVYYAGDLVIVAKSDHYEVGQIAAYYGPRGVEVLHRIIGGDAENGFVFKGDNNQSIDVDKPTADQLIGRAVLHVPRGGAWLQPLLSPTGLAMLSFLVVGGGAAAKTRRDIPRGRRKKRVKGMSRQGGSWAAALTVAKAVSRLHPALRVIAVATALAAVLAVALGVLGWMKPLTQTTRSSAGAGESMTFGYSAEVGRTPAYDVTVVHSPEPIFRKVARAVDLELDYRGKPGRIDVSARLSAGSGWHSTVQLAPAKRFADNRYTATVRLDLDGFDQRAKAAAEAIGVVSDQVAIVVTARVRHDDGATFSPTLPMSLTAVQLTLAGNVDSLTVDSATDTTAAKLVEPRQIGAFGHTVMTAAEARTYAVRLLFLALIGAVAVAVVALRRVPLNTRAQILRRYPHLIVPVEPMPSPPGKPVIAVDDVRALVKIAERYGQMILTWRRPDQADDFVVRDEGIIYRFRLDPPGRSPSLAISGEPATPAPARAPRPQKATAVAPAPPVAALLPPSPTAPDPDGPTKDAAPPGAEPTPTSTATTPAAPGHSTSAPGPSAPPASTPPPAAPSTITPAPPAQSASAPGSAAPPTEPASTPGSAPPKRTRKPKPQTEPSKTDEPAAPETDPVESAEPKPAGPARPARRNTGRRATPRPDLDKSQLSSDPRAIAESQPSGEPQATPPTAAPTAADTLVPTAEPAPPRPAKRARKPRPKTAPAAHPADAAPATPTTAPTTEPTAQTADLTAETTAQTADLTAEPTSEPTAHATEPTAEPTSEPTAHATEPTAEPPAQTTEATAQAAEPTAEPTQPADADAAATERAIADRHDLEDLLAFNRPLETARPTEAEPTPAPAPVPTADASTQPLPRASTKSPRSDGPAT